MKVWLSGLALLLLAAVVKSDYKEDMQKIDMACRTQSQVNENDLKSFFSGELKGSPSNNLKCHMKCIMEKQGHWKNGGFDNEAAVNTVKGMVHLKDREQEVLKILDECKNLTGEDECDTAYLISKCVIDHRTASQ